MGRRCKPTAVIHVFPNFNHKNQQLRPLNQKLHSLQSEVDHLKIQAAAAEAAADGFRIQIGTLTAELDALRNQNNSGPSRLSGWSLPITPANSTHMPAPKTPGPIQSPAKTAGTG